jgi:septal ring factor EnvC (AmiA/AmiB activator)
VAEHRDAESRRFTLSRTTTRSRVIALACVAALGFAAFPSAAHAQSATESLAATRAAIDDLANQWFAAQHRVNDLDLQIKTLSETLAPTEAKVERLRRIANARAIELYEGNSAGLGSVTDVITADPLEIGRRAALIAQANQDDHVVIDELEAALGDLTARRAALEDAREDQAATLDDLAAKRQELDVRLASLSRQAADATSGSELASSVRDASDSPSTASPTASNPPAPTEPAGTIPVVAPPSTGGTSGVHDEPFLVCTRGRESNGNYSVVSSNGLYHGAYQFLPTTWNSVASHAGRLDLVGVLPSQASASDQDEMAWSLYQWQGNAPWGGRC